MKDSELIQAFEALQQEHHCLRTAYEGQQQENTVLRKELAVAQGNWPSLVRSLRS